MRMDAPATREYEMPLHLQLAMRKAELEAHEMTWDQLVVALLNLYQQRILEMQAIKDLLQDENIELEFDFPTTFEMAQLADACGWEDEEEEDEDDDGNRLLPF